MAREVPRRARARRASARSRSSSGARRRPATSGRAATSARSRARYERGGRARDVGARRRAVRRLVGRPARGARGDDAAAARQGLLLDAGAPARRRARRAPTRRCSSCATSTTRPCAALHARGRARSGSTRSSRRTTPTSSTRAVALGAPVIGVNARDLSTFAIDRARAARAARARAARPDRDRRERRSRRARRPPPPSSPAPNAMLVGSTLMRAPDPGAKLARAALAAARQGLRADAPGGRRRRGRGGRRPRRLHPRRGEPAPHRRAARRARHGAARRRLRRRGATRPTPTSSSSTRARTATARATPCCCAAASRSARSSTCRGARTTRRTSSAPARPTGRVMLAGGLGPDERRGGDRRGAPVGGRLGALDRAASRASRTTTRSARWVEAAADERAHDLRRLRRPLRPRDADPGARRARAGVGRRCATTTAFRAELHGCSTTYAGRPTPLTRAERFAPDKRVYLKREDLLHTGAHKLNNALGQARARAAARQAAHRRRDRRRPARRRDRDRLRALRPRVRRLHGQRGHAPPGAERRADEPARRRGARRSSSARGR